MRNIRVIHADAIGRDIRAAPGPGQRPSYLERRRDIDNQSVQTPPDVPDEGGPSGATLNKHSSPAVQHDHINLSFLTRLSSCVLANRLVKSHANRQ
jgi:hypothetical protein